MEGESFDIKLKVYILFIVASTVLTVVTGLAGSLWNKNCQERQGETESNNQIFRLDCHLPERLKTLNTMVNISHFSVIMAASIAVPVLIRALIISQKMLRSELCWGENNKKPDN